MKDKLFVITGGGAGIGKAIASHVLKCGGRVCVIDLNTEAIEEEFAKYGDNAMIFRGDLALEKDIEIFAEKTKEMGDVFCLINNACKTHGGILKPCSHADFSKTLAVGVVAPYYLSLLLLENFASGGSIINISSTRQNQSQKNTESYSATKGGIASLTHALAVSLSGKIRVNSIAPGWIDTTGSEFSGADNFQHPAGRVGKPQDIVDMAMYLASEKAGFITGQNFVVDGGMSKVMVYHGDENWWLGE